MANQNKPEIVEIIEVIEAKYDMRYNRVKETPEYSIKGENKYQEVTEIFINSLVINLKCVGIKCSYTIIDQIFNSDLVEQYNPFEIYFNSLPKWDHSRNSEIEKLFKTVKTTNSNFFKLCLKRWLLGLVSCAVNEKEINHQMIVFSGKQGIGKSTWIRNLVPESLLDYYYSGAINPNNKDTSVFLSQCFLINLDELTNLSKKETGSLKEVITKDSINIRKAFAKKTKRLTRRASFIGSINDSEFLYDLTGSRRFLCFEVLEIDFNNDVNIDLVYAEAKYLLQKGEISYFTKEEIPNIEKNNESFRIKHPIEITILDVFEKSETDENFVLYKLRPKDIHEALGFSKHARMGDLVAIGKILSKHGYKSCKIKGDKHYILYARVSSKFDGKLGVNLKTERIKLDKEEKGVSKVG